MADQTAPGHARSTKATWITAMPVQERIRPSLKMMGIVSPAVVLAAVAGVWLGGHLRVERLRVLITVLLLVLSLILILDPLALLKS